MKKSDILKMSSEGVFNYFYPLLCKLSNENIELKEKNEQLEKENQILIEANDNLRDLLDETKKTDTNIKLDKIIKMLEEN